MHNAPMLELRDKGKSRTRFAVMSGGVVIASIFKVVGRHTGVGRST